jgi:hypothetical protein
VETDLRLYLACMPVQREHPTLGWLSELPSPLERVTPGEASAGYQDHERLMARLGGSGSSGLRISGFAAVHPSWAAVV